MRPDSRSPAHAATGRRITPANSNTRIVTATRDAQTGAARTADKALASANLGLNSDRARAAMVQRLRNQGINAPRVLTAMMAVPRHLFVDQGLASRAYEDAALPIGYGQTLSQPWVVARMIAAVLEDRQAVRVLEVGAGCGYQAAVLAQLVPQVYAIERIHGLYEGTLTRLRALNMSVHLVHGDGMLGIPDIAPFDAIIIAAAGLEIPDTLLEQLAIGARMIAPQGGAAQHLVLIERTGKTAWRRETLEAVRFVPLRPGTQ